MSISEPCAPPEPFHSHSVIPPPALTGSKRFPGAACSKPTASMRFDFPEPFGPTSTFRDCSSSSGVSGPNDRIFRSLIVLRNLLAEHAAYILLGLASALRTPGSRFSDLRPAKDRAIEEQDGTEFVENKWAIGTQNKKDDNLAASL